MLVTIDAVFFIRFLGIIVIMLGLAEASLLVTVTEESGASEKSFLFLDTLYFPLGLGSVTLALAEILKTMKIKVDKGD